MNKNIILGVGFILLAIIAYQGYLLSHKDAPSTNEVIEKKIVKKDAPEININIDKSAPTKEARTKSPNKTELTPEEQKKIDEERIQKSIQDVFKSIFASKEVQDGLTQFREQAQEGVKQLQKELQELPKKIEGLQSELKDDPFFSQILGQLKGFGAQQFEDRNDHYFLSQTIPGGKNSKVDIQIKGRFLTIMVEAKNSHKSQTTQITSEQLHQSIIMIPADALVEKLQTHYKDGLLEITIPKVKAKTSL